MPTSTHYVIKDRKYVRVTELMRARGLTDFSKIPERDRDFYMQRGTAAHKMWEHVERGTDGQYTYDQRVEMYRAAHAKFLRETGFKAIKGGIEKRVHSEEFGIAGTLDRLGLIQGKLVLCDYKSSQIYDSTAIQTALYLLCLPQYDFKDVSRYCVAFRNDGDYKMSMRYPFSDKSEALRHIHGYFKGETNGK